MDRGFHHIYLGLKSIIVNIYSMPNLRLTTKEVWLNRLDSWLVGVSERRMWPYYIYPLYTSNKTIRGWQVRFPSVLQLTNSNKAIMCSTLGGENKSLEIAIQHRDNTISNNFSYKFRRLIL
jgi:hypothetical protein